MEGECDGAAVTGDSEVGAAVGECEGLLDGDDVGDDVGDFEGEAECAIEGLLVVG